MSSNKRTLGEIYEYVTEGKDTADNYFESVLRTHSDTDSDDILDSTQETDDLVYSDADTVMAAQASLLTVGRRAERLAGHYRREARSAASPPSSDDLKKTFARWVAHPHLEAVAVSASSSNNAARGVTSSTSNTVAAVATSSSSDVVESEPVVEAGVVVDVVEDVKDQVN